MAGVFPWPVSKNLCCVMMHEARAEVFQLSDMGIKVALK